MNKIPNIATENLLRSLLRESFLIEGINSKPTMEQINGTYEFLSLSIITIYYLEKLTALYEPSARLRSQEGMDVRIGNYYPIAGGEQVVVHLRNLLDQINHKQLSSYLAHHEYEKLHPFTDGNGRSGRTLWLRMENIFFSESGLEKKFSFLHTWYYQSLQNHFSGKLQIRKIENN